MTTKNWILPMKAINIYLPILDLNIDAEVFDEEGLVCIITRNILTSWKARLDGHRSTPVAQAQKKLNYIEMEEKRLAKSHRGKCNNKQSSLKKGRGKGKTKEESTGNIKKPCKLPGHSNYDWANCYFTQKVKTSRV